MCSVGADAASGGAPLWNRSENV